MADKFVIKVAGVEKDVDVSKINSVDTVLFKKTDQGKDTFDIITFIKSFYKFEDCLDVCSSSLEIKKACKENFIVKRTMQRKNGTTTFILAYKFSESTSPNAMSSNRFISICSSQLTIALFGQYYDWNSKNYKKVTTDCTEYYKGKQVTTINRLAEKVGIPSDSILYWLYLPGVENCFDLFPIEVTSICCWRVLNNDKSGLKGDAADSIRALSTKFVKKSTTITELGVEKIRDYYNQLENCKHSSKSHKTAVEFLSTVAKIFNKDAKNLLSANDLNLIKSKEHDI
nr:nucleocapsid protein [Clematis yellow mottle associated virus]